MGARPSQFAAELERQQLGDPKVVEAIKQMTKLHRNPLIHPEVVLSTEEAIGIIGMARSAMAAMLAALPDVPSTTGAPASPMTPSCEDCFAEPVIGRAFARPVGRQ
jgi:hypothetical protein